MPEFAERFPPPAALFERVDLPASGRGKEDSSN
jgi:hypothetical protein